MQVKVILSGCLILNRIQILYLKGPSLRPLGNSTSSPHASLKEPTPPLSLLPWRSNAHTLGILHLQHPKVFGHLLLIANF